MPPNGSGAADAGAGPRTRSDAAAAALDREARRLIRNSREFRQVAEQAAAQVRERRGGRP